MNGDFISSREIGHKFGERVIECQFSFLIEFENGHGGELLRNGTNAVFSGGSGRDAFFDIGIAESLLVNDLAILGNQDRSTGLLAFSDLLKIIRKRKAKMIWGTRRREFKIDHVVDVCEGTLAYDGALVVGAVCEFIETLDQDGTGDLINRLQLFQKRLKYGLPTETTIAIYELGFSDRVIAQDLAASLNLTATQKKDLVKALKKDRDGAREVMEKYPNYFQERMNELLQ